MKYSKYIWKIKKENTYLIYSTITDQVVEIEKNMFDNISLLDKEQIKKLLRALIILPDEVDEKEVISRIYGGVDNENIAIVLIPTFECNLRCEYCYQKEYHKNGKKINIQDIRDWMERQLIKHYRKLNIQLYGGEPLLCKEDILDLISGLYKNNKDIEITVSICTNGYFLDNKFLIELQRYCEIENIQVTIHHIEELYNGYHRMVIGNINSIIKHNNFSFILRFDMDKENGKFILKFLEKLGQKRGYYVTLAPILATETYKNDKLYDNESIALISEFENLLQNEGYNVTRRLNYTCKMLLKPNVIVIDPEGYLYKCDAMAGKKKFSIGNIENFDIYHSNFNIKEIFLSSMWNQPIECFECEVMPLCMGNCRYRNNFKTQKAIICYKKLIVKAIEKKIQQRTYK